MKKSSMFQLKSLPGTIVISLFGVCGLTSTATAQIRTWTTTTPDGDSGNWSDTSKWSDNDVPDTAGESAVFGGYANDRTVTVDSTYAINKLTISPRSAGFVAKAFSLNSASGALSIGAGGIDIDNGGTAAINVPIQITADQTWHALSNPAGNANFTAVVSGSGRITRTANSGGSIFTFTAANTFSGGFEQGSNNAPITRVGSNTILNSGVIESGPLGTGSITLKGGTLSSNGATARTLHNSFVVSDTVSFGRSGSTGAITLTDADLNTPSTFTLGGAADGSISNVRVAANLTLEQAIAESGGNDQGVLFSSISGTPTVTLSRTKTAGGPILAGGVNLVLANDEANSGPLLAVNGSITATELNKFSAGMLVVDGTNLRATDSGNFSDVTGGKATIFNSGRLSLEFPPTQAEIDALVTNDSEFRLGLGTGSVSDTYTEDYDLSALGNGKAGLVSGSSGISIYEGTLSPGIDNLFRIGGGLGTLSLYSSLGGSGKSLSVEGGGVVSTSANHTFDGASSVTAGTLTLAGSDGALSGTSGITLNAATLNVETGGTGNNRINDTASLTLNNGSIVFNSNTSTGAFSETAGNLTVNSGVNSINFRTTPAANTVRTVQLGQINRSNRALLVVRGDSLGGTGTARNEIKFTNTPALIGGGGAPGSTNQSIVPWMRGVFDGAPGSGPGRFTTYDANGLRTINPTTEMVQANPTTRIDQAIAANGDSTTLNIRWNPSSASGSNVLNTASANVTLNSLWLGNSGSTAANSYSLNSGTINVTSGVVHFQHDATQNMTISTGTIAFGATEGIITSNSNGGFLTTVGANITGSAGVVISTLNGGSIGLSGDKSFSGGLTICGNGSVAVDQDGRLGAPGGSVTHGGGTLMFYSGFTTTRDLVLLGGVGDNTLANNSVFNHSWNGNISGAGRLRLINNAATASNVGFTLGGNNSYSGGTQIEGVSVTATSDSGFGTGTVTLLGGSFGGGAINFNSSAPAIGGLRGTGGTVVISPSASASTLTIGSANENGLFAGNITQGAGKTGSIEKVGNGKLILAGNNSYTGGTTVTGGILSFNQARFADASIVNVAPAATLELTHSEIDVVGEFQINGVTQAAGIYGAIGSGAPIETARITGTGRIQSTTGPSADPYEDWADDNSLAGADRAKSADPDKDGLTNLVEFALDGDPNSGTADGKSRSQVETISGEKALVITIPVLDGAVFDNIPGPSCDATVGTTTYVIEGSNDLINFDQGVTEITPALNSGLVTPNAGWSHRSFRLNGNIGGATPRGPKGFLRARIVAP